MGNRAVITWSKASDLSRTQELGVYLHWDGGINSVKAFLKYCELKGYSSPDRSDYGFTRLCQVIGNFISGANSLAINQCQFLDCDNGDNGTYICEGWDIVDIKYRRRPERADCDIEDMLLYINERQPEREKLPVGLIRSAVLGKVPRKDLQIGEKIYVQNFAGEWEVHKIIGYGKDRVVNGHDVLGVPYFDKCNHGEDNINNYVLEEYVYSAE